MSHAPTLALVASLTLAVGLLPADDPKPLPGPNDPAGANPLAGRFGAKRSELLRLGGVTESEAAVGRGLAWVVKQQKADGNWEFEAGASRSETTAATGLALLTMLGTGHTHKSGKYQKYVKLGVDWLIQDQIADGPDAGRFRHAREMYGHAIATLALCEAYGMTRDKPFLLDPCRRAVQYIVDAQGPDGGWRYAPKTPGDTSITAWVVQALFVAKLTKDIPVPERTMTDAGRYLDAAGGGGEHRPFYGYVPTSDPKPGTAVTAGGLLCRYHVSGWGPGNAGFVEGARSMLGTPVADPKPGQPKTDRRRAPKTHAEVSADKATPPDVYHTYYATRVLYLLGGDDWQEWNDGPLVDGKRTGGMRDWLVETQSAAEGPGRGSWDPDKGYMGRGTGRLGTTCLCLLTLEVYYRYPPAAKP